MKRSFRNLGFEFFSIVIAVLLALALTEWRQDYLNKRLAEQSLVNIKLEITDNLQMLESGIESVSNAVEKVNAWHRLDAVQRDTSNIGMGYNHELLNETAWEVAKINQSLTYLTSEIVMDVSSVYAVQRFYQENGNQTFHKITDIILINTSDPHAKTRAIAAYGYEIRLALNAMTTLRKYYQDFLEKYPESDN